MVGSTDTQVLVTRDGLHWGVDLDEAVDLSIYLFGGFEPDVRRALTTLLAPGMITLDIGANVGSHALHMARLVRPGGRVYAFEPTIYAMSKLRRNVELNPWASDIVVPIHAFVGDAQTTPPAAVYSSWDLEHLELGHRDHGGQLKSAAGAEAITIDAFVQRMALDRLDLIKIDVDGYETNVVRGAVDTLRRLRPYILLELCEYTLAEGGSSVRELTGALAELGYSFQSTRMRGLPGDPASLAKRVPHRGIMNVVGVPPTDSSSAATRDDSSAVHARRRSA